MTRPLAALPAAVPEIAVADVAASAEYYRDRLGFAIDWIDEEICLAGISRDDCRLFLAGGRHSVLDAETPARWWSGSTSAARPRWMNCTANGARRMRRCSRRPGRSHGDCTSSPRRIRMGIAFASSTTLPRPSANGRLRQKREPENGEEALGQGGSPSMVSSTRTR